MIGERSYVKAMAEAFYASPAAFEEEADVAIPQFPGLHDGLTIHRRIK